ECCRKETRNGGTPSLPPPLPTKTGKATETSSAGQTTDARLTEKEMTPPPPKPVDGPVPSSPGTVAAPTAGLTSGGGAPVAVQSLRQSQSGFATAEATTNAGPGRAADVGVVKVPAMPVVPRQVAPQPPTPELPAAPNSTTEAVPP